MKVTKKMRLILEILMTILLVTLVSRRFTGGFVHAQVGKVAIILFILHGIFNRAWYKNLFKGSYNRFRKVQLFINILLIIFILGVTITALSMVFKFPIPNVRDIHKFFAQGSFIILPFHIALHISSVRNRINRKTA